MEILAYLIPAALGLGLLGLGAFLWAMRNGQFEDLDGAAHRVLMEDDADSDGTSVPTLAQDPLDRGAGAFMHSAPPCCG
jgi:cbb3-type cytochrome oxidase maturation protein